ncbi:1-deoxy-D-xylulose 5-phosphate reductoisomerase [Candidatus Methanoperedenaceae archaeon GB50]|nr:MAG: 1-deoxy-D-xylulose 5-phosphate reductoisomerase [Candidatus Methanoperedenaceae archaeon GB37]CAD7781444.1 1-deoxy-D-xylulose 5-phosphate reductoisomerase [Candidatus Methanoperedenaceae archaeon GB50]
MKYLSILGSTGSIGKQTLEVVNHFKDRFKVVALGAGQNVSLLKQQIIKFKPEIACVLDKKNAQILKEGLTALNNLKILYGPEGYEICASYPKADIVLVAMLGISGLRPTLAALEANKTVALANKEALVTGGSLIKKAIKKKNQILPVDSEHSAIFQLLCEENKNYLKRIILTASGGPFWETDPSDLSNVTPEQAIKHPRWAMGAKISVDSATLMNKGLEIIEAMWLFEVGLDKIKILIHPQSIVHSLIELEDGVMLAHLGPADMRLAISYALNYPQRLSFPLKPLDLTKMPLTFFPPDFKKFPCLTLAFESAKIGGSMPVVLNAANEVAIKAFLKKQIKFTDIPLLIENIMKLHTPIKEVDLETIFTIDRQTREKAKEWIKKYT